MSHVLRIAHAPTLPQIMCMRSPNKQSPFEREAARHGIRFPGGKVDGEPWSPRRGRPASLTCCCPPDVAVVTALVVER